MHPLLSFWVALVHSIHVYDACVVSFREDEVMLCIEMRLSPKPRLLFVCISSFQKALSCGTLQAAREADQRLKAEEVRLREETKKEAERLRLEQRRLEELEKQREREREKEHGHM